MPTPPPSDPLILPERLPLAALISRFLTTNPFDPEWQALEKTALRDDYRPGLDAENRERIAELLAPTVVVAVNYLAQGVLGTPVELAYQGAALYVLWAHYAPQLQRLIDDVAVDVPFYDAFAEHHRFFFGHPGLTVPEPSHLLALFYQAWRTRYFAATKILGSSPSANAARASIWCANMGGDLCAYADGLYRRVDEIPVLITGETGTGKDLAAQCVGWSRYIPLDPMTRRFAARYDEDFHVRNICEIPRELLESTLFGHKRGSFTGAILDTPGCFSLPKPNGTLFLDEAGEIPEHVQAKLLRPFQNREYVQVGETRPRRLHGRLLFATNCDLEALCRDKTFRRDLYERMSGMRVHMPSLRDVLAEAPGELRCYVQAFVAGKIDSPARVDALTERVVNSIHVTRPDYACSGNLRELKNYTEHYVVTGGRMSAPVVVIAPAATAPAAPRMPAPASLPPAASPGAPESMCIPSSGILGPRAKAGEVSLEELNRDYVTRVHVLTHQNKAETARRVGLDWRSVSRWIDPARLVRWLAGAK